MKELLKNLAKAKSEMGAVSKDSTNPFFKSKYFDINKLIDHVEPILQEHGLMLLQPIIDNKVYSTIYDVESGQKIESFMELPTIQDPQKIGSAITYYRRYTLQSLLSLQAEDDDGNRASKPAKKKAVTNLEDADKIGNWAKSKGKTIADLKALYIFDAEVEKVLNFKLK